MTNASAPIMPLETAPHQATPQALTALEIRLVRSANAFAWSPVVRLTLDLGDYDEVFTNTIDGFLEALQTHLPSLYDHQCSVGAPGGFFQRVQEGTLLGHVLEHIALELQVLAGMDVTYGKTRRTAKKGVYNVVFSYIYDEAGVCAALSALDIVNILLRKEVPNITKMIEQLKAIATRFTPLYATQALIAEARRRSIPLVRLNGEQTDVFQLGMGKFSERFENRRHLPKTLQNTTFTGQAPEALETAIVSGMISAGILPAAAVEGQPERPQTTPTNNYRILLLNGTAPCALKIAPPIVAGDGKTSIRELITLLNRQRHTSGRLQPVDTDAETLTLLTGQDFTPESIPAKDTILRLKHEGTLENGGAVIDTSEELSLENKEFLGSIAQYCLATHGIVVAELRISTPSLRYSLLRSIEDGETFIHLSLEPDVRLYQLPTSGRGYNIAQNLLAALFPPEKPKSIPIVAITAGIGGDLLATMLDDALTDFGYTVGRATPEGLFISKQAIRQEPNTTASSILQALAHPAIDCAIAEIPLETIMRDGLCYDRADVGVVLNIAENALHDGEVADNALETREDVAHAHALVAEYLHDGGVSALNANNPLITRTVERHDNETIFFATSRMNPRLLLHCSRGGRAVLLDAETMIVREGKQESVLVRNVRLDAALDKDLLLALAASLLAFGIPTRKLQTWLTTTIERMSDDKE